MIFLLYLVLIAFAHATLINLSSYHQPFGMSLKLLPDRLACIVAIDSRIAHFDTPIEWLQASLHQQPCLQSNWVIVVALPNFPDQSVIDILVHHARVDFLATNPDQSLDSPLLIVNPNITFEISPSGIVDTSSGRPIVGEKQTQNFSTLSRKPLSNTSVFNIVWAIMISTLAGFSINYSGRAIADKRNSYASVPS
jgi:hypothetical protein